MKDRLLSFGTITLGSAGAYAAASDVLNMGEAKKTGYIDNANVVVRFAVAPTTGTVKIKVTTGATSSLGTVCYTDYTIASDGVKKVFAAPVPREHKQFLGVEVSSPSTGTASAAIELGE